MKTKLLKKVRERFSIEYYPNGGMINGIEYAPVIVVRDLQRHEILSKFYITNYEEKDKQLLLLKKCAHKILCQSINRIYHKYGTRRNKKKKLDDAKCYKEYQQEQKRKELESNQSKITWWY